MSLTLQEASRMFDISVDIKWYKGLFKGKYSVARILMVFINFLLFAAISYYLLKLTGKFKRRRDAA